MAIKVTGDAPIPNKVDQEAIKEKISKDHFVSQFTEMGKALLEETNKPNIITLEQFEPFIPMFNMDKDKYATDKDYRAQMNRLYNIYVKGLGINIYEPTIVVMSKDDPRECYYLDRIFTRVKSDVVDDDSQRSKVPSVVSRAALITREDLLLEASMLDIVKANTSPDQKAFFAKVKVDSALIQKRFVENNLNPDKRAELTKDTDSISPIGETSVSGITFELDDED
jgi:hypothetical protein